MATENIVSRKYRVLTDEDEQIYDRISFWTKAEDVHFTVSEGEPDDAQTRLGEIKGITDSLTEENKGYAADATALAKVNKGLENINIAVEDGSIYFTDKDGNKHKLNFSGQVQSKGLGNSYDNAADTFIVPAGVKKVNVSWAAGSWHAGQGDRWHIFSPYVYLKLNGTNYTHAQNGMNFVTINVNKGDEIKIYYDYIAAAKEAAPQVGTPYEQLVEQAKVVFGGGTNKRGFVTWSGGAS